MASPLFYPGAWPRYQYEADPDVPESNPQNIPDTHDAFLSVLAPRTVYSYESVAERNSNLFPTAGVTYFAFTRDTGTLWVSNNGAAWAVLAAAGGQPWTTWTPTWRDSFGNTLSYGGATLSGRYAITGKTITGAFFMNRASNTNQGGTNSSYYWSLPPGITFKDYRLVAGSAYIVQVNGTNTSDPGAINVGAVGNVVATGPSTLAIAMAAGGRLGQGFKASSAITNGWGPGDSTQFQFTGEIN